MKLAIEKLRSGKIKLTLAPDTASKPVSFEYTAEALVSVIGDVQAMIQKASQLDKFNVQIEIGAT